MYNNTGYGYGAATPGFDAISLLASAFLFIVISFVALLFVYEVYRAYTNWRISIVKSGTLAALREYDMEREQ